MNTSIITALKAGTGAVFAGALAVLTATPAAAQAIPSYATGTADETIHGTVAAVDGAYAITVRDSRGFVDNVTLHQGTIINPTGLTLAPGQSVTILGRPEGNAFAANEIDTPYESVAAYPYGYYPGPYYGYPYAYRPYAFGARFGFGRGFGFGLRGW